MALVEQITRRISPPPPSGRLSTVGLDVAAAAGALAAPRPEREQTFQSYTQGGLSTERWRTGPTTGLAPSPWTGTARLVWTLEPLMAYRLCHDDPDWPEGLEASVGGLVSASLLCINRGCSRDVVGVMRRREPSVKMHRGAWLGHRATRPDVHQGGAEPERQAPCSPDWDALAWLMSQQPAGHPLNV